jgi:hypothetical protein
MAKAPESTASVEVQDLFAKSTSDPAAIANVGKYVRTGRRWDFTHKEIVGEVIVIHRGKEITTRYGPAWLCDVDYQGNQVKVLMGGTVLQDQMQELGVNLPVLAVIRKPARSYTFMDPTKEEIQAYVDKYVNTPAEPTE